MVNNSNNINKTNNNLLLQIIEKKRHDIQVLALDRHKNSPHDEPRSTGTRPVKLCSGHIK